jgi:hypothetical protein
MILIAYTRDFQIISKSRDPSSVVRWKPTDVSDEYASSVVRVEEEDKQVINVKQADSWLTWNGIQGFTS